MSDKYEIDFVVTWVDDKDPIWCEKKQKYTGTHLSVGNTEVRFRDWDLLRYWFRGIEKYAPWVRNVFFVSDNQKPEWLNDEHPKLKWIKHTDFIPHEYLPTFNANAIEWNLHRISDLSDRFVYFNDDVFVVDKVEPTDFFVDGLPCDLPKLGILYAQGFFEHMLFNNTEVLSRCFSFRDCVKKNLPKWIKKQSIYDLLKLWTLKNTQPVPHIKSYHLHVPYLKSTFGEIWEKEYAVVDATCKNKLRTKTDITTWTARDWQLLKGDFYPKKPCGKMFHTYSMKYNSDVVEFLKNQKVKVICLNDSEGEIEFENHKLILNEIFQSLFPKKSAFEL